MAFDKIGGMLGSVVAASIGGKAKCECRFGCIVINRGYIYHLGSFFVG